MEIPLLDRWIDRLEELDVLIPRCVSTLDRFHSNAKGFESTANNGKVSIVCHGLCIETVYGSPNEVWPRELDFKTKQTWLRLLVENPWATGRNGEEKEE